MGRSEAQVLGVNEQISESRDNDGLEAVLSGNMMAESVPVGEAFGALNAGEPRSSEMEGF